MNVNPARFSTRNLTVHTYSSAGVAVVKCSGKLTAEVTGVLRSEVKSLLPHTQRIVLDLSEVAYMDSAGLGTIVGLYVSARTARCDLELINLNKRVKELLGITNVLGVFESCGRYQTRFP